MKESKVFNLLKNLEPDEFKELEKFIANSYFNKGRNLIPYFKILKIFYPDFSHKNLSNEFIFKKLFPGKKYNDVTADNHIRTLSSHLFKMCKEFLVQLELKGDFKIKKYLLLNQLRKKRVYSEFDKEFDETINTRDEIMEGSACDFSNKYLVASAKTSCEIDKDDFQKSFESTVNELEYSVVSALINCFKFEDFKNITKAYNLELRYNLMDNLLDSLDSGKLMITMKENNDRFYPYLEIFHMIYKMNRNKEKTEYYYELKDMLIKNKNIFGQSENYVLWNIMHTYCAIKNLGSEEIFTIHDHMVTNNVFRKSDDEDIHIILFRDILQNATYVGKYEWLEKFINEQSSKLHKFHRENMKHYSLAFLYFAKSEFEKSLENISKIKYDLFMFKIDMRMLQLKIYYELGYFEQCFSTISAALNYLKYTKELAEIFKEYIGNFIRFTKELLNIRLKVKYKLSEVEFLEKKINETPKVTSREWILKKVDELKQIRTL